MGAFDLVRDAFTDWRRDNAGRLGAALSYYTLFSLAPLLIVAIAVAGFFFGREAAQGQIVAQLQGLVGDAGAGAVQDMIEHSRHPAAGVLATIIGLGTLFLGATGAFTELKSALNVVWDVKDEGGGVLSLLRGRLWAFAMVLAVGFLLLVSLLISAALAGADGFFAWMGVPRAMAQLVNSTVSFLVITVLFALLFKYLPDTPDRLARRLGRRAADVGPVHRRQAVHRPVPRTQQRRAPSTAPPAPVVVLVVWVYYAAQIFFFGAEVTQAYAHGTGRAGRARRASGARGSRAPPARIERRWRACPCWSPTTRFHRIARGIPGLAPGLPATDRAAGPTREPGGRRARRSCARRTASTTPSRTGKAGW